MKFPKRVCGVTLATCLLFVWTSDGLAGVPSRGERALRASFYSNTVPTVLEVIGELKTVIVQGLELDAHTAAVVTKAIDELWTEEQIYAHSAAALEKRMSITDLDAAIAAMGPDAQAMIKDGVSEGGSPEQTQLWYLEARNHRDAKERDALVRRIVTHMPGADAFGELFQLIADVMAEVAVVSLGTMEGVDVLRAGLMNNFAPLLKTMEQKDAFVLGTTIAYRHQPTAKLQKMADALDSPTSKRLHEAALHSILEGCREIQGELIDRIQRELGAMRE